MSTYPVEAPLSTYLATPITGAPATTATLLIKGLTPISYQLPGEPGTMPHHYGLDYNSVATLAGTQGFYASMVFPSVATPAGTTFSECIALSLQAIKEMTTLSPICFTATTTSNGTLTINLTTYALANPPIVQVTCHQTVAGQSNNAVITAKSATSLTIITYVTQNILLGIVNPVVGAATLVEVTLFPQ